MTNESASTFPPRIFPSHQYDFGDHVSVLPLQESGAVEAIAYRSHDDTWHYRLTGLAHSPECWWMQDELKRCDKPLDSERGEQSVQTVTVPQA